MDNGTGPTPDREAIQAAICEALAEGASLRSISAREGMPANSTIFRWLADDEDFREQYARAREMQAERLFEEILEIADTPELGVKTTTKADGTVELVEADMIEHRRLRVDARKWAASKLLPRKYGEATLIKHADADGKKIARDYSPEQIAVRLASMMAAIGKTEGGSE